MRQESNMNVRVDRVLELVVHRTGCAQHGLAMRRSRRSRRCRRAGAMDWIGAKL